MPPSRPAVSLQCADNPRCAGCFSLAYGLPVPKSRPINCGRSFGDAIHVESTPDLFFIHIVDLGRAARESFVIRVPVKSALQTRRRNLERVRRVDEIFDVEDGPELLADFGAIPVCHASRLINEHPNNGTIVGAGHFRVDQLDSVVDGGLLGKLANALLHRP